MKADLNLKTIRFCDHLIDIVIGLIAAWTFVFHVSNLFNLTRDETIILSLIHI